MTNTQTIKRKDLQDIYSKVCGDWQKEITQLVLFQSGDNIEVSDELITKAFSQADSGQKTLMKKYFKIKDGSEAFDKIKDYKSFCKYFGIKELTIKDFEQFGDQAKKMFAFHKIKNFETYFNDGWKPDWSNSNEYKWYPYFEFKKGSGGWCFYGSDVRIYISYAVAAFYKDQKIADFIGKTFLDIYSDFMSN